MDSSGSAIKIENVWKVFGNTSSEALDAIQNKKISKNEALEKYNSVIGVSDVSFDVKQGEIFCVMGLSGSGKSTLVRHINRLLEPTSGKILINGHDVMTFNRESLQELRKINSDSFTFNGFIEGNHIKDGNVDVIVTDGFSGNIALKTAEGTAKYIAALVKEKFLRSWYSKFIYLLSFKIFNSIKNDLDPRKYNGGIFLGLTSPVVKSHGGTDYIGFYHSIKLCYDILNGNLQEQIQKNL